MNGLENFDTNIVSDSCFRKDDKMFESNEEAEMARAFLLIAFDIDRLQLGMISGPVWCDWITNFWDGSNTRVGKLGPADSLIAKKLQLCETLVV